MPAGAHIIDLGGSFYHSSRAMRYAVWAMIAT